MANVREGKRQPDGSVDATPENVEDTASELHRLRDRLRANGEQLEDELRDASEHFADGARTLGAAAAEQIRAHPLAAFGIAFAAGVIASRLLRGGR